MICTVNVSSFMATPTIFRPSLVTAVTVSYRRAPALTGPLVFGQVARRLSNGLDEIGARPRRTHRGELRADPAAAALHEVTRATAPAAEEQRLPACGVASGRGDGLLQRAQVGDDLPDLLGLQVGVGGHRGARHAAADRGGQLLVRAAVAPGAGREIGTAHAAAGRHAVAEHALLPEQHGALCDGAGIGDDRRRRGLPCLRRRDLSR